MRGEEAALTWGGDGLEIGSAVSLTSFPVKKRADWREETY